MNLHYKIIEVYPNDNLIVVRYWTDILTEKFLAADSQLNGLGEPARCRSDVSITLPIPTPTGDELDKILVQNAPIDWLKMMETVLDPAVDTSLDPIYPLVNQTFTKNMEDLVQEGVNALTDADIEKLIDSITNGNTDTTGNTAVT
jgi:hypothetical protein